MQRNHNSIIEVSGKKWENGRWNWSVDIIIVLRVWKFIETETEDFGKETAHGVSMSPSEDPGMFFSSVQQSVNELQQIDEGMYFCPKDDANYTDSRGKRVQTSACSSQRRPWIYALEIVQHIMRIMHQTFQGKEVGKSSGDPSSGRESGMETNNRNDRRRGIR